MGLLDALFGQVSQAIQNHSSPDTPGPAYDANPLLETLSSIFGQTANEHQQEFGSGGGYGNVAPSSQDPFGDPADQEGYAGQAGYGNVAPSSQDPFGDPADQEGQGINNAGYGGGGYGNVAPSSQDPYGDPADRR